MNELDALLDRLVLLVREQERFGLGPRAGEIDQTREEIKRWVRDRERRAVAQGVAEALHPGGERPNPY